MPPRHLAIRVAEYSLAIPPPNRFWRSYLWRISYRRTFALVARGTTDRLIAWALFSVFSGTAMLPHASAHGTYHDLIEQIDIELAASPDDGGLLFRRAEINLGHHEWMLAVLDLKRVEALSPGKFPTRWLKGQALEQGGKFISAKSELDAFLLAHPGHGGALASRGRVLRKLGDHQAALADFRAALSNTTAYDPEWVIEISGALADAGAIEEAANLLDSSLKRDGENTAVLLKALEIELKAKRWDTALRRVDSLQTAAPRPEPWMAKRAEILALAGRADESQAAWSLLTVHLQSLPNLERGMQDISRQAQDAIHPPDNFAVTVSSDTLSVSLPADNATGVGASTTLTVNITDPGEARTVTFHGRKRAPLVPGPDFTLGTIPDTQFYSQNTGGTRAATFYQQTRWYADNRDALNLAFVSHMGDMVQNNDSVEAEWITASAAMDTVENQPANLLAYGIPWGGAPGNHDVAGSGSTGNKVNAKWNQYFGNSRWAGKPYYRGSFSATSSGSNYQFFSASGLDFIIIHLEYMTSGNQAVLDWADALMKAHPHRRAIVTSHWILTTPPTSPVPAQAPFAGPGQAIYDNLKDNPNLFMTLCGHVSNEGRRADAYQGRVIHSLLQDYQDRANGGDGWLRYYVFSPSNGTIRAKTYSPKLGIFETNADNVQSPADTQLNEASEFILTYDMQGSVSDWIPLGTVNVAANETSASLPWTGLEKSSAYEWFASSDSGSSAVARFATTAAAAPSVALTSPVNHANISLPSAVNITATAADTDGTVAKVAFYQGNTLLNVDTTAPYGYAWSAPNGAYTLTAIATDNEGNTTLSNVVTFDVSRAPNILPTVTLTSPADGAGVEAGTLSLTATAADADGSIAKVEFFSGAEKIGEATSSPFTYDWPEVAPGSYSLTAKATDNDSGSATSESATITVTPAGVFDTSYFQNFDGMGLSGTTRRPAWTSWNAEAGSNSGSWTTSIPVSGVASMTETTGVLGVANPPSATNINGFNAGLGAANADRQFGSSPSGRAGVAHQLQLTNTSGGQITKLHIAYDIRRYNASSSANELPGYWLFYSLDGTTWANVSALNPTASNVPNTSGVTSIPATDFTLTGPWNHNTILRLRWVDDNGSTSPDQMYGLDNLIIHAGVNAATSLTATPVVNGDGITLAWTDNSHNESGFRIERKTAADTLWNLLTTSPANMTSHADDTAGPGVAFDYRVTAFNASVTGETSNIANSAAYTALQDWKLAIQGNPNAPNNTDGDGVPDLLEFAFGLNPTLNDSGPVHVDIPGGLLTNRGQPAVWYQAASEGTDFRVLFLRRKDHLSAGLTYTPQFSGDMTTWEDSAVIPTVVADGGEVEAVTIVYPLFVAGKEARFFRVGVRSDP